MQTAGVKRVKEMIEALNTGDYATIRAYFDAQSDPNGFANALGRYHLSRGFDLLRVELVPIVATSSRESSATELPEMRTTSRSG